AEECIVLLKNADNQLPLTNAVHSIAIIGSHADVGTLSGGGSAQVDSPGGNAIGTPGHNATVWGQPVYFPSAPLRYIREKVPGAKVEYNDGTDPAAAAKFAKGSDVAIVFVNQWMSEGRDSATLSLPNNQDALVSAVAAANPHTIVVLETGGPVSMPWAGDVKGIMEAWYPGIGGAQAIANLLFGDVNPSGKLPVTFAARDEDLPHPTVTGIDNKPQPVTPEPGSKSKRRRYEIVPFDVDYNTEGARVGYKWFESEHKTPLFAFGHGLSYTTYEYSDLKVSLMHHNISFAVKNTGSRAGTEIAQVYVMLPPSAGEHYKRLIGWDRVTLAPGESKTVSVDIKPAYVSIFNEQKDDWDHVQGDYKVFVGPASDQTPLTKDVHVAF
ncbi:MAG TPA: glycoside hydrolase family 3 C-terminal domain-containing protein, partial [Acidisarcina sp.]